MIRLPGLSCGLVALGTLLPALVRADEPREPAPAVVVGPDVPLAAPAPCALPCCPPQIYLVPEQTATTLQALTLRAVEVGRETKTEFVVEWKEEKQICTEMELKPRIVEQQVACTTMQAETVIDPYTGKPCTIMKEVPVVRTVKLTVFDLVPVEKVYLIRRPCLKTVEKPVVVSQFVVDTTTIPAIETRFHLATVPEPILAPAPCLPK